MDSNTDTEDLIDDADVTPSTTIPKKEEEDEVKSDVESVQVSEDEIQAEPETVPEDVHRRVRASFGRPVRQATIIKENEDGGSTIETKNIDSDKEQTDDEGDAEKMSDFEAVDASDEEPSVVVSEVVDYDSVLHDQFQRLTVSNNTFDRGRSGSDFSDMSEVHPPREENVSGGLTEEETLSDKECSNPGKRRRKPRSAPPVDFGDDSESEPDPPFLKPKSENLKKVLLVPPSPCDDGGTDVEDLSMDEDYVVAASVPSNGDNTMLTIKEVLTDLTIEENGS